MNYILVFAPDGRLLGSDPAGAISLASGGDGYIYADRSSVDQLWFDPTSRAFAPGSSLPSLPFTGRHIAAARHAIWQIGIQGELGFTPKQGIGPAMLMHNGMLATLGLTGRVSGLATDGREVFFAVDVTVTNPAHVWAVDFVPAGPVFRPLLVLPQAHQPRIGPTISLGADRDLLILDHTSVLRIDIDSGAVLATEVAPSDPAFATGGGSVVIDPWTSELAAAPWSTYLSLWRKVPGSAWHLIAFGSGVQIALVAAAPRPFESYGRGCVTSAGLEPRMGSSGLPRPGQTFQLTLRQLQAGSLSVFWLGTSDAAWSGWALPFLGAQVGAPGCALWASPDVSFVGVADSNGRDRFPIPVPADPALAGMLVFAQGATSSGVNAFGFAFSDALSILIR
ncbi:MAG: hypothetical protein IPK26_12325 [Planctomycetes bacterium]|nr:hypothetical protein [Planctomycetota bacterium]